MPEHQREPDRDDEEADDSGPPRSHRSPEDELEHDPEQGGCGHCEEDGGDHRTAQGDVDGEGHVGTEREVLAVGEVHDLEDSVDEGEPDCRDGDDRARHEPVRDELQQVAHVIREPTATLTWIGQRSSGRPAASWPCSPSRHET